MPIVYQSTLNDCLSRCGEIPNGSIPITYNPDFHQQRGQTMDYQLHDFVGNLGVAMILATYFLVQIRKLDATGLTYISLNFLGAALILYSLLFDFNLSAFIIEFVWALISLVGLRRFLREKSRDRT